MGTSWRVAENKNMSRRPSRREELVWFLQRWNFLLWSRQVQSCRDCGSGFHWGSSTSLHGFSPPLSSFYRYHVTASKRTKTKQKKSQKIKNKKNPTAASLVNNRDRGLNYWLLSCKRKMKDKTLKTKSLKNCFGKSRHVCQSVRCEGGSVGRGGGG